MVEINSWSNTQAIPPPHPDAGRSPRAAAGIAMATAAEVQRTISVITLAFSRDPVLRWMYPEPHQYLSHFPAFAEAFAGKAFEEATAHRTGDFSGAALWLPPGVSPDEEALVQVLERTLSDAALAKVLAVFEQLAVYHPRDPHWYLPLIGVDPARQGQGIGAALLQHALVGCDRDRLPAYLESSNALNISLYERHGFTVQGEIQAAGSPPLYPMRREAR